MSRRFYSPLFIACTLAGISGSAYADTYSAVNDFSLNPQPENGVWTYLGNGSPLTQTETVLNGTGNLFLWTNGNMASIAKNTGPVGPISNTVFIPNDYLNLDPEDLPNVSVDFTAPETGIYNITGGFIGDDNGSNNGGVVPIHTVSVMDNSSTLYSGQITQFGAGDNDTFDLTETLNAGDQIAFVVDSNDWHNLGTGLQATIVSTSFNSTPEPGSVTLLFGLGVSGAGLMIRRRKAKHPIL